MWKKKLYSSTPLSTILLRTSKIPKIHSPNSVSHKNITLLDPLLQTSASFSSSSSPFVEIEGVSFPTVGGIFFGGPTFHRENVNLFVKKKNSFCSESKSAEKLQCWNCDATADGATPFLVCQSCRSVQPVNHSIDYFQILGVERKYNIEVEKLEGKYKNWQKKLHPDLVHSKSQLKLENVVVDEEERITDPELLAEIMELREAVEEAEGNQALNQIKAQIQDKMQYWCKSFEDAFLNKKYEDAIASIQRMTYYKRANEEIIKKL
ncbi:iron-sulfur cluster co-chaperone protein HscB [Forsythia ovata]|uniref:Iron-sulfur cluster co-chaperone protein HscB n=1 Tax=Forsythia ovata TaxID=205694 RepID=A0ABD1SQZ8_9LAMI